MYRFLAAASLGLACLSVPASVHALERVEIVLPPEAADLREPLETASLSRAALSEGELEGSEAFGAALADYRRMVEALYAQGHYGGTVNVLVDGREAATIPLLSVPQRVEAIEIRVDPGPRYRLSRADLGPVAPGTVLPEGFVVGGPARAALVREAVEVSVDGWREIGHAKARAAGQQVVANHAADTLSVGVTIDPGPRPRFGDLVIEGGETVRERRIRQIAGLPTGEVFDPDELRLIARRLRRVQAFSSVALREGPANPDGTLDIVLDLADAKPRRFGFGAEISSLDGLTLSGFWLHRNLRGGAERLRVDGEIAQIGGGDGFRGGDGIDFALGARLERPSTLGPNNDGFAEFRLASTDDPAFREDKASVSVGIRRYVSERFEQSLAIEVLTAETVDAAGRRTYTLATLPFWNRLDTRDDRLDPTAGLYAQLALRPIVSFDGATLGLRTTFDGRAYRRLGERVTVAGRAQFGSLYNVTATDVPADFLFFSGGTQTVRGHPFQSLTAPGGQGGRSFLGLAAEVRAGITDRFGLVGFYDAGYVGAEELVDFSGEVHAGAGLGLRYRTPIGPIRVDVAAPVSGPTGDGVQFYIGIGQAF
ncbi:MAG: autotransporter assembly complex protein TamA [Shimia sp.]